MGMPDPRYKSENRAVELRQARNFWAFKKVTKPPVAKYDDGTEIDAILNLEIEKIQFSMLSRVYMAFHAPVNPLAF